MTGMKKKQTAITLSVLLGIMLGTCLANEVSALSNIPLTAMTHEQFESWYAQTIAKSGEDANIHPVGLIRGHVGRLATGLAAGDLISVDVSGLEEFSRDKMPVYTDGYVDLPYIGELNVFGKTVQELETILTEEYRHYILEPHVSVTVSRPPTAYVLGAVSKPGAYAQEAMPTGPRLSAVLENAGGITEFGDIGNVHIFNEDTGTHRVVNLADLIMFGRAENDPILRPNDVVYVPRLDGLDPMDASMLNLVARSTIGKQEFPVRIHGLVRQPDVYMLKPGEMTLHTIISKARGLKKEGRPRKVVIARTNADGTFSKLVVDATRRDVMLRPNDIVIVGD